MKKLIIILFIALISGDLLAQKIEYKSGLLQVDGKDMAKVVKIKDISSNKEHDIYEFSLPDGLVIVTVRFARVNGVKNCNMSTNKDKNTQNLGLKSNGIYGELKFKSAGVDRIMWLYSI